MFMNTTSVRNKNTQLWHLDSQKLRERLRGNGWTVFKRLIYDYRNHLGNGKRSRQQQLPYVDAQGYLVTSPALITHAEAKAMSNRTVSRWIERFRDEFDLNDQYFVLDYQLISHERIRLKLNETFFILEDQGNDPKQKKQGQEYPKKPPKHDDEHIDVSKLAKKFNRKHHIR